MGIAEVADKIVNSHHMRFEPLLCSRHRTSRSGCSLCADLCPVDAIRINENGVDITEGCIDCGVCFSACPNGAMKIDGKDDRSLIARIGETPGVKQGTFTISCERGSATAHLLVSCLGRLTEGLLLDVFRSGAPKVAILRPPCRECPNGKTFLHQDKIIRNAQALLEMTGASGESLYVEEVTLQAPVKTEELMSRRDLFGALRAKVMGAAVAALPDIGRKEEAGELFKDALHHRPQNLRRSLLLETLRGMLPGVAHGAEGMERVHVPAGEGMPAEVAVDSRCIGCSVCSTLCPTGALSGRWTEDRYILGFRPALCTNCKVCEQTCMRKAIKIKDEASLDLLLAQEEVVLLDALKKSCPACRVDFIGGDGEICPLCIDRHRRQVATILDLNKGEDGHE